MCMCIYTHTYMLSVGNLPKRDIRSEKKGRGSLWKRLAYYSSQISSFSLLALKYTVVIRAAQCWSTLNL